MSTAPGLPHPHFPVRREWLAQHDEPAIDPQRGIVDAHHHLWERSTSRYFLADFLADTAAGHRIESSVFMECGAMYLQAGPEEMRCVGEVEFARGAALMAASVPGEATAACAAIVGHGEMLLGDAIAPVLEAQLHAGGGRFRGVRRIAAWHADPAARGSVSSPPPGLLADPRLRAAMRALGRYGLSFDTFAYHTQLSELAELARAVPEVPIVANHIGGAIGIGPYAGRGEEVFASWRAGLEELAACPNTCIKLGGLGMRVFGHGFGDRPHPPSSRELAAAWGPYLETCIEIFGAGRCMFESNFPVDKGSCSYGVLWNAFKRVAAGASPDEKEALFRGTARRVYRLEDEGD